MNAAVDVTPQWRSQVIEKFMRLVQSPAGDFDCIKALASAVKEPGTLKLMVEHLEREPQCRQALQLKPRLGEVAIAQLHQLPANTLTASSDGR